MRLRLYKDKKIRKNYSINELKIIAYKFLIYNSKLKKNSNFFFNLINLNFFHNFFKNNTKTKIHNYCIISGRSRGIVSFFHVSRLTFRELASQGLIPGIKKSVW